MWTGNEVFVANSTDIDIVFFFAERSFIVLSNATKKNLKISVTNG